MSRVRRIITSFAIVLGTYWAYRLTAVPLIEPEAVARSTDAAAAPILDGRDSVRRHEALLAQLYADGAWQRDDPIVFEGDHVMFVMKEWQSLANGQVRLNPCTMIFFPSGDPNADPTAVRRAIVLEAPQGALLQFDEAFDIRRAKIGKLVGGHMPGTITVRGSTGPNGQDEIFAQTHDVQLSENRIWTPHPVEFRIGPSYGSGREMQIHLLPAQGNGGRGPNIGGIESFELLYEVSMHLQPQGDGMFPGDRPSVPPREDATAPPQPPIDIACQGPFRFELGTSTASFRDQVNVVRASRGTQSDQLTCEKLSIFFQPRSNGAHDGTAQARGPQRGMSNLEPRRLEAHGLPVVVTSPSTGTYAKGQHLEYDVVLGSLKLAAEDEALLHQEANEVRGRKISYQPLTPPGGTAATAPADASAQGPPQISIVGAAQLRSADYGQLTAEEIHVWLLEMGGELQGQPRGQGSRPRTRFAPDRLMASGNVDIRTAAVSSPADKPIDTLEVWFRQVPPGQQPPTVSALASSLGPQSAQVPAASEPNVQGVLPAPATRGQQPQQHYEVAGERLQMQVLMEGRRTIVDRVTILGNVFFAESTPDDGERPLAVTGNQLQVENATTPDTAVTVVGSPAHVEARGLSLEGSKINLSRRENRLWIDGPGQMTVPIDRDLQGRALSAARPMNVTWREKMDFDGLTARFVGQIEARTEGQVMRTETMDASLAKRIDFNQPPRGERPQVALLVCRSGVFVEGQSIEPEPPSVQRMQMGDLSIDQITGRVRASGPGRMTMVRLGRPPALDGDAARGLPLGAPRVPAQPVADGKPADANASRAPQLMYLNVTFRDEITGNINERQLIFRGQVDTLYGPVKSWDDQLNADRIEGLGPQGVHLQSDDLKVIDMTTNGGPSNREIEALGNVRAEGMTFTARCGSLRYAEAKDLITLSGDGRSPANLYRQQVVGGPKDRASAGKIFYWPGSQRVEVEDARMLDLGQLQTPPATPPSTPAPKKQAR